MMLVFLSLAAFSEGVYWSKIFHTAPDCLVQGQKSGTPDKNTILFNALRRCLQLPRVTTR